MALKPAFFPPCMQRWGEHAGVTGCLPSVGFRAEKSSILGELSRLGDTLLLVLDRGVAVGYVVASTKAPSWAE